MIRLIWVLIFGCCLGGSLQAQVIPGEVIVLLKPGTDISVWLSGKNFNQSRNLSHLLLKRTLSGKMNLHLCMVADENPGYLALLQQDNHVLAVQYNYRVRNRDREIPDDPSFNLQWGLEKIMAPEAWTVTTGGITASGDTIVVAVLETGCEIDHEDLIGSTWRNHEEIPDDGLDNDNNGYIDDYLGWNFNTSNDQHPADFHGTAVNGILGATGDNGTGVSGVNWQIKRMVLSHGSDLSEILEGYAYAKFMRDRYNASNGQEGAFVVATNSSFGIDEARPNDYPVWCAIYDSLGNSGILSAVAPPNKDINVEVIGDMPSRCTSEFVISTTNTNQADEKFLQAGWGKVSVDLGTPGDQSFTTWNNNAYGIFGGTSSSVPHLTGAIALMYSIPETSLTLESKSNPKKVARLVKSLLFEGVDPLPSLENKTLTGGRLNIFNSIAILLGLEGKSQELAISGLFPNPSNGQITLLIEHPSQPFSLTIYNSIGQNVHFYEYADTSLNFSRLDLDLGFLKPGIYMVKLATSTEKQVRKIVVY